MAGISAIPFVGLRLLSSSWADQHLVEVRQCAAAQLFDLAQRLEGLIGLIGQPGGSGLQNHDVDRVPTASYSSRNDTGSFVRDRGGYDASLLCFEVVDGLREYFGASLVAADGDSDPAIQPEQQEPRRSPRDPDRRGRRTSLSDSAKAAPPTVRTGHPDRSGDATE